jgi:hypothetical protein
VENQKAGISRRNAPSKRNRWLVLLGVQGLTRCARKCEGHSSGKSHAPKVSPLGPDNKIVKPQLTAVIVSNLKSNILGATLAIISSIALFWFVTFYFQLDFPSTVQRSLGVATGHPEWMVFQSRVLGPYIIKALSFILVRSYSTAYVWFQIVTVAIAAFLCWRLGRKYGGDKQSALQALMLFVICFVWLLSPPLPLSWDIIDIIVFAVFIDFVLSGSSLPWFVGLFAISIFNRDSAGFIALWLILDAFIRFFYSRRNNLSKTPFDWHRLFAGAICIGVGLIIVEFLKQNLLIEEMGPKLIPNSPTAPRSRYNVGLFLNIDFLKHVLFNYQVQLFQFWLVAPFIAAVITLGARLVRLDPQRYLSIYLIELSILAVLFAFAAINETRVFVILIPFVVLSGILVLSSKNLKASSSSLRLPAAGLRVRMPTRTCDDRK